MYISNTVEQTLSNILGFEVGFVKIAAESADRFENASLTQPNWAFRRGMRCITLEFQAMEKPEAAYGSIHLVSADKVVKFSGVEPDRWACTARLLAGPETNQILNSLQEPK